MKNILSAFLIPAMLSALTGKAETVSLEGQTVRVWDFENCRNWKTHRGMDTYPADFTNNYTWGKKEIEIRPCQGYRGTGLQIHIKGISQGEMQFWTAPWTMARNRFYKISFRAKGIDFSGTVEAKVRKIVAWKVLIRGIRFRPSNEWREYSFSGPGGTDIDRDFGVMFSSAGMGRIMIDDIRVEEFQENPEKAVVRRNANPLVRGNLIPNSSCEIARNPFWSVSLTGNNPDLQWEDPGFRRTDKEGKFGKHCFVLDPVKTGGRGLAMNVQSLDIPVASGSPYTLSFWMKSRGNAALWCGFQSQKVNGRHLKATRLIRPGKDWKRYSITSSLVPDLIDCVRIEFQKSGPAEVFVDGIQFEAGSKASEYKPSHPYEIEAALEDGLPNIVPWGKKLQLLLSAWPAIKGGLAKEIPATLKVVAYPERTVLEEKVVLTPGKTLKKELEPGVNGIMRLMLIPEDPAAAAMHENVAARLPEPRNDIGAESFFGTHFAVRPYFIDYAKRLGFRWQRLHDCSNITKMKWGNPEPGKYQWKDEAVDAILKAGFHILGLPDYPAPHARRSGGGKGNPIHVKIYADWCRKAAEHYRGRIDTWEIWNEPYISYFYPGDAQQFAELFQAAFKALKEGNPNAKVLGWCSELTTAGFIAKLPKSEISGIDAVSFHVYFQHPPGDGTLSVKNDLEEFRKKILILRDPGEYWNTEGSWGGFRSLFYSFRSRREEHSEAAAAGSRIWIEQKKAGIGKFFYYTLHQTDTMSYRGGYKMLIEYDRSPTVSAAATAVTAWFIDGLDPRPFPPEKGVVQALFSGKGRTAFTIHDDAATEGRRKFDLSRLPPSYLVCDVMGNDLRKKTERAFSLGPTPVFVLAETPEYENVLQNCRKAIRD